MNKRTLMSLVLAVACTLTLAAASYAQPQNAPFSKVRLMKLLLLDTSPQELIPAVNQKGVDFQPTPQDENELRQSGASDDLMAAIRANYRGGSNNAAAAPQTEAQPQSAQPMPQPQPQQQPAQTYPQQQAYTQAQPANNQRPQKRSFLDKLNDAIQVASTVNTMVQSTRRRGGEPLSEPDAAVALTTGSLSNTGWYLTSMTATGTNEKPLKTPSDVRFCDDGGWVIHFADGTKESGKYKVEGDRLIMKSDDGSLFSDCKIDQNSNDMTLDDGKYVLRLKYRGAVKC